MATYIIVSEKRWNCVLIEKLRNLFPQDNWILIDKRDNFILPVIDKYKPYRIFIPHWSYLIPQEIYKKYNNIVFHMTDLPFGRGGSPLQNLISRGIYKTKISAISVTDKIDAGDIYIKRDLCLFGSAEEIFIRGNAIIEEMIVDIIKNNITPTPQKGEIVCFKRRTPEESNLDEAHTITQIYDYIRMLDAEGYPHAFIENNGFHYEFTRVSMKADGSITADVKITQIKNINDASK